MVSHTCLLTPEVDHEAIGWTTLLSRSWPSTSRSPWAPRSDAAGGDRYHDPDRIGNVWTMIRPYVERRQTIHIMPLTITAFVLAFFARLTPLRMLASASIVSALWTEPNRRPRIRWCCIYSC